VSPSKPESPVPLDWRWLLALWAVAAATLVVRSLVAETGRPLFADTDDAMRMVVVRDFLAGQGWYDLVQHRLNTPFGAEIHWSRLVDLPLALLLSALTPLLGADTALLAAGTVWPLLLLGVLLYLSARTTLELVGPEGLLPALVLPVLSPAILAEFTPGRVDHHNVIILFTLATLWASLVALRRPGFAWLAGLVAATALAVAIEAIPLVVAAILAFGIAYVADPARARAGAMGRFGLALGGGLALHLALARPPARWLEAACDMLSPVYVLAGLLVGAAYLLVALLPAPRRAPVRLLLLAALGLAAAAAVVFAYPQCLAGPYGDLDPWLQRNWIAAIVEAKPWHASLAELPAYALAVGVPAFLAMAVVLFALWRDARHRLGWLVLLVFLALATAIMLAQVRGARLVVMPAVPAAAWLIVMARRAYLRRASAASVAGLVGGWLAFSGVILATLVGLTVNALPAGRPQVVQQARASKLPCLLDAAFADLRALPPERVMAPIDLGSHLLLETPHEVVAAPYHRNEAGVLDAFRFFNRPVEEARAIAVRRGLGLVVTCPAMPEMQGVGTRETPALVDLLAAGTPPGWLAEVPAPGPLRVYAVMP